jgi:hypothetical protein
VSGVECRVSSGGFLITGPVENTFMPTVEVTEAQVAYLEALRTAIADEVPYGHVRERDAVQYLIDNHREGATLAVEVGSLDVDADVDHGDDPNSGTTVGDSGSSPAGPDEDDAGVEENEGETGLTTGDGATTPEEEDATEVADAVASAGRSSTDTEPETEAATATTASTSTSGGASAPGENGDDGTNGPSEVNTTVVSGSSASNPLLGGGDDKLSRMRGLLDEHDDKWRDAVGDGKYEVDLPDGSTETVQTRDDIRGLLFKHY